MIGKDILRFHAIYWPAFLLAANIPPPKRVYGHGWILSGEVKMSKSKGNILDPLEIVEKYGIDPLRYYLLKEVSFGNDGNISKEKLENCINSDLANNYGNLCQRVISFNEKYCNLEVPEKSDFNKEDLDLLDNYKDNIDKLRSFIDKQDLNSYINFIVEGLFSANKYFNDQEPWKKKSDLARLNTIVYVSLEVIRKISIMLYPIIPESSLKVLDVLGLNENDLKFESIKNHEKLKIKNKIKKINILFKKIEE
jgi:methionyl-tRNA synthetase